MQIYKKFKLKRVDIKAGEVYTKPTAKGKKVNEMTWKVNSSVVRDKGDIDDLIFAGDSKTNNQPVQIHSER